MKIRQALQMTRHVHGEINAGMIHLTLGENIYPTWASSEENIINFYNRLSSENRQKLLVWLRKQYIPDLSILNQMYSIVSLLWKRLEKEGPDNLKMLWYNSRPRIVTFFLSRMNQNDFSSLCDWAEENLVEEEILLAEASREIDLFPCEKLNENDEIKKAQENIRKKQGGQPMEFVARNMDDLKRAFGEV